MAKRIAGTALCVVFLAGIVLQAAGAYAEEKSPIYNDVKKFFHFSDEYPESPAVKKTPDHFWNMLGEMIRGPHERKAGK